MFYNDQTTLGSVGYMACHSSPHAMHEYSCAPIKPYFQSPVVSWIALHSSDLECKSKSSNCLSLWVRVWIQVDEF